MSSLDPQFKITGHRGAPVYAPENTLKSFQKAFECGATAIEFDVRVTADGVPVILHDESLERIAGVRKFVAEISFEGLREVKVGGEKIPTLEEVLAFAKGKLAVDIEVKVPGVEEKVVDLVKKYGLVEETLITSFIPGVLSRIKEIEPRLRVGILSSEWDDEYLDIASSLNAYALLPNYSFIDEEVVKKAKAWGYRLIVWTVNSVEDIRKMLSLGVDGIITDDPCRAREIIG